MTSEGHFVSRSPPHRPCPLWRSRLRVASAQEKIAGDQDTYFALVEGFLSVQLDHRSRRFGEIRGQRVALLLSFQTEKFLLDHLGTMNSDSSSFGRC